MGVYFTSYEYIMRICSPEGENAAKTPLFISFLAGGISGCNSWFCTYPIDYLKTVIQSDNIDDRKYRNSIHCAMEKYK
jgi:solute carrier family 25 carnitine/acylcarnitine transporter 20/29